MWFLLFLSIVDCDRVAPPISVTVDLADLFDPTRSNTPVSVQSKAPAIGARWEISIGHHKAGNIDIDFELEGNAYRSALLLSFRFDEGDLVLNSHSTRWHREERYTIPVNPNRHFKVVVTLEVEKFVIHIESADNKYWYAYYTHQLPYPELSNVTVLGAP